MKIIHFRRRSRAWQTGRGVALPKIEYGKEAREQAELRARLLEVNKLAANYFYHQLKSPQGQLGYQYLREKRQLSDQTIVRFGLGYANKTSDDLYRFLREKGYDDAFLKETGLVAVEERGGKGQVLEPGYVSDYGCK